MTPFHHPVSGEIFESSNGFLFKGLYSGKKRKVANFVGCTLSMHCRFIIFGKYFMRIKY